MTKTQIQIGMRVKSPALVSPLSFRQQQMLTLLGAGMTDKDIGAHLGVSVATVKATMGTIYDKLDLSCGDRNPRVLAAHYAALAGLVVVI